MVDRSEFERWRRDAEQALRQARVSEDAELHNWACFSSEQAAQMAVKALLHGLGQEPQGHDLFVLGQRLRDAGLEVSPEVVDAMRRLSRLYTTSRYPDTLPAGSASDHYGPRDSRQAMADAETVLALVDEGWRALDA